MQQLNIIATYETVNETLDWRHCFIHRQKKEFRTIEDVVVLKPSMKSIENGLRNTIN
jgi:hypothetical protein